MIEPARQNSTDSSHQQDSNEIIEISSTETDSDDDDDADSASSSDFPLLRKIDEYLNGEISSGALESSDSSIIKTETEDDSEISGNQQVDPALSPSPQRERVSRNRKATEFFGNPVPSSLRLMVVSC